MKRYISLIMALLVVAAMFAQTEELLDNHSFEESSSSLFGVSFSDWTIQAGLEAETVDVIDGSQAMHVTEATISGTLSQEVSMLNESVGQEYELIIHYKVLSGSASALSLDCFWETGTESSSTHDADSLQFSLQSGTGWQTVTTHTTKPLDGRKLHVRVRYAKSTNVLFDDFSLKRTERLEPWFTITPETCGKATAEMGDSILAKTFTVRMGNLTHPVTLDVTGTNAQEWHLSQTSVTTDGQTVNLWYRPTTAGNHRATLLVDCVDATICSRTISLSGSATNSNLSPQITIKPTSLPVFTAKVGETRTDTVWVSSSDCVDYINVAVSSADQQNMFLISSAMLPKNGSYPLAITFRPSAVGSYSATITCSSTGANAVSLQVQGTATSAGTQPSEASFDTLFSFNTTLPLEQLQESFDDAETYRNKTFVKAGWQNVVRSGNRAWWGYTSTEETMSAAKATGYIYQGPLVGDSMEVWLITPALRYAVQEQNFGFSVRGDLLYPEQTARLEVFYIDATNPKNPYFEHIEALDTIIPSKDEQLSGKWYPVQMSLAGIPNPPQAFFIGFRYIDYLGAGGSVYYIDDVSWGSPMVAVENVSSDRHDARLIFHNGTLYILRDGRRYTLSGMLVEDDK